VKIPHVKTLVNCSLADEDIARIHEIPVVSCNKAVARLNVLEFFEAEELGVALLTHVSIVVDVRSVLTVMLWCRGKKS